MTETTEPCKTCKHFKMAVPTFPERVRVCSLPHSKRDLNKFSCYREQK